MVTSPVAHVEGPTLPELRALQNTMPWFDAVFDRGLKKYFVLQMRVDNHASTFHSMGPLRFAYASWVMSYI